MSFVTKVDFSRQIKQYSGTTGILSGSTRIRQNLDVLGSISGNTISGGTYYSGSTDLSNLFATIVNSIGDYVNISGDTMLGKLTTPNLSATTINSDNFTGITISSTTISASTYYSGSTLLDTLLGGGTATNVQPGVNISTGGTASKPIINLKSDIFVNSLSATTITGITISATTFSADTIYGNSSNPYYYKGGAGNFVSGVNGVTISDAAITTTSNIEGSNLSATTFIFSGSSNLDTLFASKGIYKNIYIDAGAMVSNTSSGATSNTEQYTGTSLNTNNLMSDYFAFTGESREEAVQFRIGFIDDWDLGTIKSKIYWDADKDGSGGVTWGIKVGALSNDDALSGETIFGTEVNISDTLITYQDLHVTSASTAITVGGLPALDDLILFQITRKISDGNDTLTKDAKLLGCGIQYKEKLTGTTQW